MRVNIIVVSLLLWNTFSLLAGNSRINIEDFGAKGDGVFLNTKPIQQAIDMCSSQGGGIVTISKGIFLSGSIFIKDNVTLHLEANAVLLGSKKAVDYQSLGTFIDALGNAKTRFFVGASGAKNIAIEGNGVIDGQGDSEEFIAKGPNGDVRPSLVKFYNCDKVRVSGITLRNSGCWVSHYFGCTDVLIQNININSWTNGNNDGIDIDSSIDVRIINCNISSGDDAICLKATANRPTRNVVVSNCILNTDHGAFKIGTESAGDIQNVTVSNCAIDGAGGGIKLICMDGGIVRNVNISDIVMQKVEMPIFVRLGSRLRVFHEGEKQKQTGSIEQVKIQNIIAKTFSPGRRDNHYLKYQSGIFITGVPGHRVTDLSMENISIEIHGGGQKDDVLVEVPENIAKYPEFNFFSEWLPAYGAYVRHAEGIHIENIVFQTANPDKRYVLATDDVKDITLKKIKTESTENSASFYAFRNTEHSFISEHFLTKDVESFLTLDGILNKEINLSNNSLERVKKVVVTINGATETPVENMD